MDADLDDEEKSEGAAWMATFADLMTLLLTFFVLLISFATMDVIKFQMMLGSVKEAMGVQNRHPGAIPTLATVPVPLSDRESTNKLVIMDDMAILNDIRQQILKANLQAFVEAELGERGVIVRVRGQLLYDLGSDDLRSDGLSVLDTIATISHKFETRLMVEGHTDSAPIATTQFPSNWELSTGRAISAMRYLVASPSLPRERIEVAGYAETRPIAPNGSLENRAKNRRVEFVFIRMVDPDDRTVSIDMSAPGGPLISLSPVEWVEPEAIPFGPVELVPRAPLSSERVISDE